MLKGRRSLASKQSSTIFFRGTHGAVSTAWCGMRTLSCSKRNLFWVFPRDGMGKCFRLFAAGWEWDGKVGSHLVDGTGQDHTTSWWDGIWERVGNLVRKSVGNIVGNLVENMVKKRCREWLGTQWGTGAGDNGRERGKCYRVLYTTRYTYICVQ